MVRRLVALVRASRQARGGRTDLEKGLFPIARQRLLTGQAGQQGDHLRAGCRRKAAPIARHRATRGRKVVPIARPGLEARGVRVVAQQVVAVRPGRPMGGHRMEMGVPVVAQVIVGLPPADQ